MFLEIVLCVGALPVKSVSYVPVDTDECSQNVVAAHREPGSLVVDNQELSLGLDGGD